MKKLITFFFVLLLAFPLSLIAEDANTLYHTGAQAYIGGNIADALTSVELGLALEPEHPELRTLYEKLKEEQEKQQQQQNQEQQEQEKQEKQEQQDQEQQDQEQQEQEQKEQEQKEQEQQDQEQQDKEKQDKEQQPKPQPAEEEKKEISKEEAERILQALRSKEKENKNLRKPKGRAKGKVAKDW
ncbi:MAG: hypothetical protein ACRBF0_05925 [Calditrichia bacterium]